MTIRRVSVASDGTQGNFLSSNPSISSDGRYIAFSSDANNLVSGDTNGTEDIFVHDRVSGTTSRVSVASDGTQGNYGGSLPSISSDGRYVAFESLANNLVPGDTNGIQDIYRGNDIFVHDRNTGTTSRVSVATNGTQGNASSYSASISSDGRYIAFESNANNLVSGDTNGARDIFVHDRETGTTTRVSVASDGTQGNNHSEFHSISGDGRYVAFTSWANNLVLGDTNGARDIFVHDRVSGITTRVSVASDGTQGNASSYSASISSDGRYIAFESNANNLVLGDTNNTEDIFVHDRVSGTTSRVTAGSQPSISSDGRYVAFYSGASLVPGDTNGRADVFVHDRNTGTTTRASVAADGTQANPLIGGSYFPKISSDGRYVAFVSDANNLVPGDTNGREDVFVVDFESIPQVSPGILAFSNGDYSVNENSGQANITITRTNGSFGFVSVTVNGYGIRATPFSDYTHNLPITLNFAQGETSKTITIPIRDDRVTDPSESIYLFLSNPTNGASLGGNNFSILNILDDDYFHDVFSFSNSNYSVNENGGQANITITRTDGSDTAVSVTVNRSGGTATPNNDYTDNLPITLNFAEGETSKTLTIPILNDTAVEGSEIINLTLSNPTNGASLGTTSTSVLTIVDDDQTSPPTGPGGTPGNDRLVGTARNDVLDGQAGDDTMEGYGGNDTYIVDSAGDVIIEQLNAGSDTVRSTVNHTLDNHVETLILIGTATEGTGNSLNNSLTGNAEANTLTGNAGNDTLNGGAGADNLIGGDGNDSYTVDSADTITEDSTRGTDTVTATTNYTLSDNLERLTLTGTATEGTGNSIANTITGNAEANTLTGLAGNDTLNGGVGNDTLIGGLGNDSYTVDSADTITEDSTGGTDTVTATTNYTLSDNLERLTLTGTAIEGTGNSIANTITGNAEANTLTGLAGNDTLNGGAGADNLIGGDGNDSYTIDSADTITEDSTGGTDAVSTPSNYTLEANLEKLTLTGTASVDGIGNELNNSITGNAGNNNLRGEAGNDTLTGGTGNDTLIGGLGNDSLIGGIGSDNFVFNSWSERIDTVRDFVVADDTIVLPSDGLTAGVLDASMFVLGTRATTADHRVIYNSTNGALFFDADGTGATAAIQFATLPRNLSSLDNNDFLVG